MKILVVDDKPEDRYFLETVLKGKGYAVVSAENGKEALERLKEGGISIVISDILMPVMDGYSLCKEIRSNEKLKDIPIVFYSATYTDEKDEELALSVGADKFIRKPMEVENFLYEIEKVLKEAQERKIKVRRIEKREEDVFKLYSERLVQKLEKRAIQLREFSQRLNRIYESVNDLIFTLDENGNFTDINCRIESFGYKKEEVLGRHFTEFITSESKEIALGYLNRTEKGESIKDFCEIELLKKDGDTTIFELNVSTIYEKGKFVGRFGVARDVTEKKRIEEDLKKSEEKYRLIAENVSDVIFTMDMNLQSTYVSPSVIRLRGFSAEETMKQSLKDVLTHSSYEIAVKALEEELEKEKDPNKDLYRSRILELENKCKDGSTVLTETRLTFLRDSLGEPVGILGVSRDITERKKSEEAKRLAEEKYSRLFEESKTIIFITYPDGKFIDVNPPGVELLGYSSKEDLLKEDLLSHFVDPEERENRNKILQEKGNLDDFEVKLKRRDGSEITVLEATSAVRNSKGEIVAYRGILRDITAYKKMESQILQAQKLEAIGRLAGGIAHDFSNLLTAIMGNVELVLINLPEDNPQRGRLKTIMDTALKASQLTRKLLAFSKKQISLPKLVNLNDLISEMRGMLERILGEDIKFELYLSSFLFPVKVDPTHIEQIILNLAVNSREAMPDGGKLIISTENVYLDEEDCRRYAKLTPGDYILLSVSDTGGGISKDILDHIFEPFFTTKESGTGMGLSIVYGVVKQYGGDITVYSELGKGTTFKIYLPAEKELITKEKETLHHEEVVKGGKETILVVEDEKDVRELVETVLSELGYKVFSVSNKKEASELMVKLGKEINLLISDVILPDARGQQLAREFMKEYPDLKVLLISGYPDEKISIEKEKRMDFLPKPFSPKTLAGRVREFLDRNN